MIKKILEAVIFSILLVGFQVEDNIQVDVPQEKPVQQYSESDLYWLSRVIYSEAGADYCSDELQIAVGSVVLNRVKSEFYPNNIKDVIFDNRWGVQYGCSTNGMIYLEPNKRAIENAKNLLINGSQLPSNVLGQAHTNTLNQIYTIIDGVVFSSL